MAEQSPAAARTYYRKQQARLDKHLAAHRRYKGRIKDVRERDLWRRLADEIDAYLRLTDDPDDREPVEATEDDVALF